MGRFSYQQSFYAVEITETSLTSNEFVYTQMFTEVSPSLAKQWKGNSVDCLLHLSLLTRDFLSPLGFRDDIRENLEV